MSNLPVTTVPPAARTLSIVVPAFNEEAGLAASLAAIRRGAAAIEAIGWETELIVCDNNSTDRTAAIARDAGARVVFEPVNQISRARNAGASLATGAWLMFIDADSRPSDRLFLDTARALADGSVLALGSTIVMPNPSLLVRAGVSLWNGLSRINRWAAGSFIVCDRQVFAQAGGFSVELYAAEELDLFQRLKRIARRSGRTIRILHRHPIWTSDRKVRLYSPREMLLFNLRTIMGFGRTLKSAKGAFIWYDGRRDSGDST